MNEVCNELLTILLKVLLSVILALAGKAAKEFTTYMKNRAESEKSKAAFEELDVIVQDGIDFIEQTVVRKQKANEKWDEESQRQALAECAEYISNSLSTKTLDVLKDSREDIGNLILEKIESCLGKSHR